jgi:hypothetical protein
MGTRTRITWKLDKQGQYARQIGWKRLDSGKLTQHKFRLGADLKEAQRREQRLRELWEQIEKQRPAGGAEWTEETLDFARQIAKGSTLIELAQLPNESHANYAKRLHLTQKKYPAVTITGEDRENHALGMIALRGAHEVQVLSRETLRQLTTGFDNQNALELGVSPLQRTGEGSGARLHEAFTAYIEWIKKGYFRPGLERVNDSGLTMIRQMETLIERHEDVSLESLDYEAVEAMFQFWQQRPIRKGSKLPISKVSAENYIGLLKRFFRWLHKEKKRFAWRKPEAFEEISTRVEAVPDEKQRRLTQVKTFGLDELAKLNEVATPLERVFLMLALNCGFGAKEIATLTIQEVVLFKGHCDRDQEILRFKTTAADSFIKRVRRKNSIYGEWILFPQTVDALRWALKRRRSLPGFEPSSPLILNSHGERYDKPTKGDHRNQQIPNRFNDLTKRARATLETFPKLSFGKLRKTAGDLIRNFSDGEVSGVFLCHGQAVETDDLADIYTNRPFGKVFEAIRRVEQYLQPVFDAAGSNPFGE